MPTLLDRDWSWLELAAAPAAAVLLPLVLHRIFSSRKTKIVQACTSSAGPETLEDYITKHGMSELDAKFQVAVDFVAARAGKRLTNEQRLTLYAFYKQALFGACAVEKPSAADFVGSAKWESWRALGTMEADAAKQQYLALVQDLFDDFDVSGARPRSVSSDSCSSREELSLGNSISTAGFVSMPTVDMTSAEWQVQEDAFHFASTGDAAKVAHALKTGFAVDAQDSEGRTMLHWAVDRSQTDVVALLLQHAASPNVQDGDGMTPLHYAASCEHDELAQLLVDHGACVDIEDNDGETPLSCAPTDELAAILAVGKTQAAR